jgi:predicted Zn-dependent peptidase
MHLQTRILANGLTVASVRLPGFRSLTLAAMIGTGSRDEPAELNGISHFLEHMAFKGTARRSARALALDIERVGASMNAYTARDHTAFHTLMLREHLPVAMDVMADVVLHSTFPQDEIERERRVILQEIGEAADDPDTLLQDAFDLRAWPQQAFGRPILGSARFVRSVSREDFLTHRQAHYGACRMVLIAVGDVDLDPLVELADRHFGDMPRGLPPVREPARYGGGFRHLEEDFEQTSIALGFPVPGRMSDDFLTYELLGELLGGGMSSPLFQSIRETRGLAYQVDAWTEGHPDCGMLQLSAGVAPRHVRECLAVACDELVALARHIPEDDLERTRNQQLTHLARLQERPLDLAESIGRDLLMQGRATLPQERMVAARAVSSEQLRNAARQLIEQPPTLALVGPAARTDLLGLVRRRLSGASIPSLKSA